MLSKLKISNQKQLVFVRLEMHQSTKKHYLIHSRNSPLRHSHLFTPQTSKKHWIYITKLLIFHQVTSQISKIQLKFLKEQLISLRCLVSAKRQRCLPSSLRTLITLSQLKNLHLQMQQVQEDSQIENQINISN